MKFRTTLALLLPVAILPFTAGATTEESSSESTSYATYSLPTEYSADNYTFTYSVSGSNVNFTLANTGKGYISLEKSTLILKNSSDSTVDKYLSYSSLSGINSRNRLIGPGETVIGNDYYENVTEASVSLIAYQKFDATISDPAEWEITETSYSGGYTKRVIKLHYNTKTINHCTVLFDYDLNGQTGYSYDYETFSTKTSHWELSISTLGDSSAPETNTFNLKAVKLVNGTDSTRRFTGFPLTMLVISLICLAACLTAIPLAIVYMVKYNKIKNRQEAK